MRKNAGLVATVLSGACLALQTVTVEASPEATLAACQSGVAKESRRYTDQYLRTVEGCLGKISSLVLQSGLEPTAAVESTADRCVRQLLRLHVAPGETARTGSPAARLQDRILRACDRDAPGSNAEHAPEDVLGVGVLDQQLRAGDLGDWCASFEDGGDVNDLDGWTSCLESRLTCAARESLVTRYPRSVEWLSLLDQAITPLAADGSEDATAALEALRTLVNAIDRDADGLPDIECSAPPAVCGDGVVDAGEQCDGPDLDGASCLTLGFTAGTTDCSVGCAYDTSGCFQAKRAFVTSERYAVPVDFNSLAEADAICQSAAESAGLAAAGLPVYRAWLSDAATDAIDRIAGITAGTFADTRGTIVKSGGFGDGLPLDRGIVYDEQGVEYSDIHGPVFTGTNRFGRKTAAHCANWSSGGASTTKGTAGTVHSREWTEGGVSTPCSVTRRLYCMEEG